MKKVWLSWSSGKDSAWMLHALRRREDIEVCGLITSINTAAQRVAMHGVHRSLLEAQARAIGLDLFVVELPWPCSNDIYEVSMERAWTHVKEEGADAVAFGDLFLEEIRDYRVRQLEGTRLAPMFPLWGTPTRPLAQRIIADGVRAVLTCVDPEQLDPGYVGRAFDAELLEELPEEVDPCGERGEFHTLVWDGPMFGGCVPIEVGASIQRGGFWYCDVTLAETSQR